MDSCDREMYDRQKLSEAICFIMDNVGYGDEMRRFRIQEYDKASKLIYSFLSSPLGLTCYNTGSKAEGLSLPFQGDMDIMFVYNDSVCVDDPSVSGELNILRAEYNNMAPPGYVHVSAFQLTNSSLTDSGVAIAKSNFFTNESGQKLVSSSIFRNVFIKNESSFPIPHYDNYIVDNSTTFNGPAVTKTVSSNYDQAFELLSFDFVQAVYFYTSKYLDHWKERSRYNNWPNSAMLEDIAQSEGYIVPVGSAESNLPNLEWRVSYVTAEQKLLRSLNPTQAKLFVVLKMISKELLSSEGSGISSYVMKNVVLWVCELYGRDMFVPDLLLDQIATALLFLKLCLQNNHVPNYIIPERNLIAGRLNVQTKTNIISRLSDLMKNRTYIFYKLNIFRKHLPILCMSPSCIRSYGEKRDTVEKLYLLELVLVARVYKLDNVLRASSYKDLISEYCKDDNYLKVRFELIKLIVPEWITLYFTNQRELDKLYNERLYRYLS